MSRLKKLKRIASNIINGPEYKDTDKDLLDYSFSTHSIVYVYNKLYIGGDHEELSVNGLNNWLNSINADEDFKDNFFEQLFEGIDVYQKYPELKSFWAEKSSKELNTIDVFIISNMNENEVSEIIFEKFPYCKINFCY
jgi:hypothetical protein